MTTETTPKKISLTIPDSTSSKVDELAFLNKIRNSLSGTQTYLEQLFSVKLCDWFEGKARDDWACDIAEAYEYEVSQSRQDTTLKITCEDLSQKYTNLKETAAGNARELAEIWQANQDYHQRLDIQSNEIFILRDNNFDLRTELEQAKERANCLEKILGEKDQAIIELKAQLWDLTQKGGDR